MMVKIFKDMLKQGIIPQHVLEQAIGHEKALREIKAGEEREAALKDVRSFIRELEAKIAAPGAFQDA